MVYKLFQHIEFVSSKLLWMIVVGNAHSTLLYSIHDTINVWVEEMSARSDKITQASMNSVNACDCTS